MLCLSLQVFVQWRGADSSCSHTLYQHAKQQCQGQPQAYFAYWNRYCCRERKRCGNWTNAVFSLHHHWAVQQPPTHSLAGFYDISVLCEATTAVPLSQVTASVKVHGCSYRSDLRYPLKTHTQATPPCQSASPGPSTLYRSDQIGSNLALHVCTAQSAQLFFQVPLTLIDLIRRWKRQRYPAALRTGPA
jgi:hypothetical protein